MMTRAEGKKQRKALDRERARHLKEQDRAKVRELRADVKRKRAEKAQRIRDARAQCRRHRILVVKRAKERRKRLLEELRTTTKLERKAARERCSTSKQTTRASALSDLEKATHALQHERAYQRELKRIEANNKATHCSIVRASRSEREQESAGEVEANIPAEYVPLWRRVAKRIKGSGRRSRTEAFLAYAEEHPREVVEAQEDNVDAVIRELEAKMRHHVKRARSSTRYTRAELDAVPF